MEKSVQAAGAPAPVEAPAVYTERPKYRLIQPFYAEDVLFGEGRVIFFDGVPNEAMEPLNDHAIAKTKEFLSHLAGGKTPLLEDAVFKAVNERPRNEMGAFGIVTADDDGKPPIMGTVRMDGRKSVETVKTIEDVTPAPAPPRQLMGTPSDRAV